MLIFVYISCHFRCNNEYEHVQTMLQALVGLLSHIHAGFIFNFWFTYFSVIISCCQAMSFSMKTLPVWILVSHLKVINGQKSVKLVWRGDRVPYGNWAHQSNCLSPGANYYLYLVYKQDNKKKLGLVFKMCSWSSKKG